jgi:hypothetical protein
MFTFLNSHILIFEKLIFPTMSKIAKFGKKTQGILGFNNGFNSDIQSFFTIQYWSQ